MAWAYDPDYGGNRWYPDYEVNPVTPPGGGGGGNGDDGKGDGDGFNIDPNSLKGWNYGGIGDWYSSWFKDFWGRKDVQDFLGTSTQDRPWQSGVDSWMDNWQKAQKPMDQYYQPAMEKMNQRGVLNSSITGDAIADITEDRNRARNEEMNKAETQQSQNWNRKYSTLMQLAELAKYQQGENNSGWATLLASLFGGQ